MPDALTLHRIKKVEPVWVGQLCLGPGFPIYVQTMWKGLLPTSEEGLLEEIRRLEGKGCQILRFAVQRTEEAELLGRLQQKISMPLVADIHFDYRLALAAIRAGVAKVRINPGNIGSPFKVAEVFRAAQDHNIPIRVGINAGSLPRALRREGNLVSAMLKAAEDELELLEKFSFKQAVFSFKSSSVLETIAVNRAFRSRYTYPLHLGLTEAGPLLQGAVKNTAAIFTLLAEGIGETIRVSLTDDPHLELSTAYAILKALGFPVARINLVSCPTCSRTVFPVRTFYERIQGQLVQLNKDLTIAIMGCPVNGPGEASHADLGISGTKKEVIIFKHGRIIRRELMENAEKAFLEELAKL